MKKKELINRWYSSLTRGGTAKRMFSRLQGKDIIFISPWFYDRTYDPSFVSPALYLITRSRQKKKIVKTFAHFSDTKSSKYVLIQRGKQGAKRVSFTACHSSKL